MSSHRPPSRVRPWLCAALAAGLAVPAVAGARIAYQPGVTPFTRIVVAENDGGSPRTLAVRGSSPVISPDATRVAFQTPFGTTAPTIRFVDVATGAVVEGSQKCLGRLVWSPDSTRVLCGTEAADAEGVVSGNGLAIVDAATGTAGTLVPARGVAVGGYVWSPDSSRIAFARGRFASSATNVYVMNPDGTGTRLLMRNAAAPVWGPRKIALARITQVTAVIGGRRERFPHSQIWTVNPNGGGAHQLTHYRHTQFLITGPFPEIWTPSGNALVGTVGGTDVSDLITVNATTGAIRRLGPQDAGPHAISTDGRTILYTRGFVAGALHTETIGLNGARRRPLLNGAISLSASADWTR